MEKSEFKLQSKKKEYLIKSLPSSSYYENSLIESNESIIISDGDSESLNSSLKSINVSLLSFDELKQKLKKEKMYFSEKNYNIKEEKNKSKNMKKNEEKNNNREEKKDNNEKNLIKDKNKETKKDKKLNKNEKNFLKNNVNKSKKKKIENDIYNKEISDLFLRKFLSKINNKMMFLDEDDFCCEIEYFLDKYSILVKKKFEVNDLILLLQNKLNM